MGFEVVANIQTLGRKLAKSKPIWANLVRCSARRLDAAELKRKRSRASSDFSL